MRRMYSFACIQRSAGPIGALAAVVAAVFVCGAPAARAAVRFSPPDESSMLAAQLQPLAGTIAPSAAADDAARFQSLLRDHGDDLIAGSAGRLVTVAEALRELPAANLSALTPSYRQQVDEQAAQMLRAAVADPSAGVERFYDIARRYPLSSSGGAALAAGADRAALRGDWPSALAMYEMATALGWQADADHADRIARLRRLDAAPATGGAAPAADGKYFGAMPFEAPWYGTPIRAGMATSPRYFPLAAGGTVYIATARQALAISSEGAIVWTVATGTSTPATPAGGGAKFSNRLRSSGRRPGGAGLPLDPGIPTAGLSPVALVAGGSVPLLVVRSVGESGAAGLSAVRASDGHVLWSTADDPAMNGLWIAPDPLVVGGYVYALASDTTGQVGKLLVIALDVTGGRQRWRCELGSFTSGPAFTRGNRMEPPDLAPFDDPAAMAVSGDALLLAPNIGYVVSVGRFDGKLRWFSKYPSSDDDPAQQQEGATQRDRPSLRYLNRPLIAAGLMVVAPQDSLYAWALDPRTGEEKWHTIDRRDDALIGASGDTLVFAGRKIIGLHADTGKLSWAWDEQRIVGPAVVDGPLVIVPTPKKRVTVSAKNGSTAVVPIAVPDFDFLMSALAVRSALSDADALFAFMHTAKPPKVTPIEVEPRLDRLDGPMLP